MSENSLSDTGTSAIEVRIYRHEQLIARQLCESEDDAAAVVDEDDPIADAAVPDRGWE